MCALSLEEPTRTTLPSPVAAKPRLTLEDRFTQTDGVVALSGTQALLRLPLEQQRADAHAGLRTASLISGYQGSPLAGIDLMLTRYRDLFGRFEVEHIPAVNEDLAATAIMGSQMANLMPGPKFDGVLGMWYGKAPGVDRSGDIFKHANLMGVGRHGGVLALAGDDPVSKSSSVPCTSETALYDAQMPILFPGTIKDILRLGRYGFELSRFSGLWVGFKIVTNIADAYESITVEEVTVPWPAFEVRGQLWRPTQSPVLLPPHNLAVERELVEERVEAARVFGRESDLNQVVVDPEDAWLGIAAPGKAYYDVQEALWSFGFTPERLRAAGVRLMRIDLMYPMHRDDVRYFARGLEEIVVVEEKRAFIEMFFKELLYGMPDAPRIVGDYDERGQRLVPAVSELTPDVIAPLLAQRLQQRLPVEYFAGRLSALQEASTGPEMLQMVQTQRTPYFCSGCPHNRSTVLPADTQSLAGAGIGCHALALTMDRGLSSMTHMGGEGAQWAGMAPFVQAEHFFQNVGDGTFFHSGSLAVRQAVAAQVNITFKVLYNGTVAMTGGQDATGSMDVPALAQHLKSEGVKRVIVLSHDPKQYRGKHLGQGVRLWPRDRLEEAQRDLAAIPGVTALIYEQPCAAELRRKRKRGKAPDPAKRILISERVCEGCGDCGRKSNCLSVLPVETEFGRKTQVHQPSCNKDYTCVEGDCPAFITVIPDEKSVAAQREARLKQLTIAPLQDPVRQVGESANLFMMGIGGTGVVTLNQILATAALLEHKHALALDQTGLSQKGGAVVSHLKITVEPRGESPLIGKGLADSYIAFDILSATTDANLSKASPTRSVAVVSDTRVPTGMMVRDIHARFPELALLKRRIDSVTRLENNVYLNAQQLAETLFDSHMPANFITLGAAYQAGLIPLSHESIEQAITLNGVAVTRNIQAFYVGRRVVCEPEWVAGILDPPPQEITASIPDEVTELLAPLHVSGELARVLALRTAELIAYQNYAYAQRYITFIGEVIAAERAVSPQSTRLSEAVAHYLHKLMAYKDEYEVARLQLRPELHAGIREQFGEGARIHYQLHPPVFRRLGLKPKLSLGRWFDGMFKLLYTMRGLRGTPFDPFGRDKVRRQERQLISAYKQELYRALEGLSSENLHRAVELAQLPDMIRGYEELKLTAIEAYYEAVKAHHESQEEAEGVLQTV